MFTQKNLSRSLRLVVMTLASLILTTGAIWAQNVKVSGTVSDVNGEPLIGAYVLLQGTTTGTSTDVDGKYVIDVPANGTLVFQLMGMQDVVTPVNNRSVINVTMEEDAVMLEDVVVTALGIKK
ncbi:MAG: carboxypeptidase-like regulatory domain-containing protein, partial [Bacteroidales bacterium]|nr:carboxypeptidase-like regulatory domain-containing protein [Bacteroidales bacterium]